MGPKIESVIHFLRNGGMEAVITSFELLCEAVAGRAGTRIVGDAEPTRATAAQELEEPVLR
jgi:carbamate kinase